MKHHKTPLTVYTFILIVAMLMSAFTLKAQSSSASSILWKIEGKDLNKPSYLLGTSHMICEDQFNLPAKVKVALDQTQQSYLEIDMANPNFVTEAQKYMKTSEPFDKTVNEEDYKFIDSLLSLKLKTSLQNVKNIKPMIILSSLMQASIPCKIVSMEGEIIKNAVQHHKKTGGLSSIEEQYGFMGQIFKPKDFVPYLKTWSDHNINEAFKAINKAYLAEDLQTIDKLMTEFYATDPEGYKILLPVRNRLWANRMPLIMKETPTMFAIGSGHLLGKEGVINLLKEQGYKVTPILN